MLKKQISILKVRLRADLSSLKMAQRKPWASCFPGDYEFNTDDKELMEISSGGLEVLLSGEDWIEIRAGESFEVPAKSKFKLKIMQTTDYCCSFLK